MPETHTNTKKTNPTGAAVLPRVSGPDVVKATPEWPSLTSLFRSDLFDSYAGSLVRMILFGVECGKDHSCVTDEIKIFQRREGELRAHISKYKSRRLWNDVVRQVDAHVRRLAVRRLDLYEISEEVEQAVREEIARADISVLTS